jgi:hypothetical protein
MQAIRSQYRRTYLGPWWLTVQQIIFVAGLSLLFGTLMGRDLKTFVPYVAVGFIAFNWMMAERPHSPATHPSSRLPPDRCRSTRFATSQAGQSSSSTTPS